MGAALGYRAKSGNRAQTLILRFRGMSIRGYGIQGILGMCLTTLTTISTEILDVVAKPLLHGSLIFSPQTPKRALRQKSLANTNVGS